MGLAEPKRKVKYSIDPNVLHWANNEDKFGKRLMEKMGWEKGKGLGAKENGMTENIKVRVKSDTKGIGYNNNEYENVWLDHQDDFEKLLNNLSQNNNGSNSKLETNLNEKIDDLNVQSLEQKSKQSRRLHYKKFTRSKDLSSVTQNDLNCILGNKKRSELARTNSNDSNKESSSIEDSQDDLDSFKVSFSLNQTKIESKKEDENNTEDYFGLKFNTNKISINDYFANKMASKFNKSKDNIIDETKKEELVNEDKDEETDIVKKKKKKKNKYKKQEEEEDNENQVQEIPVIIEKDIEENLQEESTEKKSKKKKKKEKRDQEEQDVLSITVQGEINEQFTNESEENLDNNEPLKKKKKKSKDKNQETTEDDFNTKVKSSFQGSNLLDINGYSAYFINSNLEEVINEKVKKLNRKRNLMSKKLEIDIDYYKMSRKMNV